MPAPMSFKQDVRLWKRFCTGPSDQNALPTTLQATLENMNARQFPNICVVLRVLLLLPVTSAQVERAHSALKYIKTVRSFGILWESIDSMLLSYCMCTKISV